MITCLICHRDISAHAAANNVYDFTLCAPPCCEKPLHRQCFDSWTDGTDECPSCRTLLSRNQIDRIFRQSPILTECQLCSDTIRKRRHLFCRHQFCLRCLAKWIENACQLRAVPTCPICRGPIPASEIHTFQEMTQHLTWHAIRHCVRHSRHTFLENGVEPHVLDGLVREHVERHVGTEWSGDPEKCHRYFQVAVEKWPVVKVAEYFMEYFNRAIIDLPRRLRYRDAMWQMLRCYCKMHVCTWECGETCWVPDMLPWSEPDEW